MPRPRPTARVVRFDHDGPLALPAPLAAVLDADDPALTAITRRIASARVAGEDVHAPDVLAQCIAAGRGDHAAQQLGASA